MAKTLNFGKITKTIAAAGTAEPLMAASNVDRYVDAFKVYVPITNTGTNVYIGDSTADNTWDPITKGSKESFSANQEKWGEGMQFDLSQVYADVDTDGDSVIVIFVKAVDSPN